MPTQTRAQAKSAARDLARDRVFDTVELLETILLHLDPKNTLLACGINRVCQNTFNGSTLLKRHCFLEQDPTKVASKPTMGDVWCAATEDENGRCNDDLFRGWPEDMAAGLYNPLFLCLEDYFDGYQNMPFKYGTHYWKPLKQLPSIFLEYNDTKQTGYMSIDWPHFTSSELGSLGQMFFTSHPIPKLEIEVWGGNVSPHPRGQVIDVVFGLIAKACIAQKRRKDLQRELMALQYYGPWDINIDDEGQDMSDRCKEFAREHGLEKWNKVFDGELAGLCLDEVKIKDESWYYRSGV